MSNNEASSYKETRGRRRRIVRSRTEAVGRLAKHVLDAGRAEFPEDTAHLRPKTRAECVDGVRPCPFVSCQYNLYLDVSPAGSIRFNFPDIEPAEMATSCVLDVVDEEGDVTLERAGELLNITREALRLAELRAMSRPGVRETLGGFTEGGPDGKRRLPVLQPMLDEDDDVEDVYATSMGSEET